MGYYRMQGDFYAGYRGDPGFFSALGSIAKRAVGFIPGVGPAISAGVDIVKGVIRRPAVTKATEIIKTGVKMAQAHPAITAAGAAGVGVATAAAVKGHMGAATAAGKAMMAPGAAGVGGGFRRRRRMRVTNPKALRRALRRAYGFEKLAMRVIRLTSPKKHRGFGGFKHRKKKRI